ncbi:MAG: hypothetical protein GVY09_09585 [Gammaproteobacteria bacterium]|jgi:hypothetical protein|nr:hypothetical protein [Gammaproteobacteria bacterium]
MAGEAGGLIQVLPEAARRRRVHLPVRGQQAAAEVEPARQAARPHGAAQQRERLGGFRAIGELCAACGNTRMRGRRRRLAAGSRKQHQTQYKDSDGSATGQPRPPLRPGYGSHALCTTAIS